MSDETMLPFPVATCINGREVRCAVTPRKSLADFLRDDLALTGTHVGCEHGVCGACTVLVDGVSARACLMLAVQADGAAITTIEGLESKDGPHALQQSFHALHGLQCGFCTPGIMMTLLELLRTESDPGENQVREALSGHLCRCTGYQNIVAAALDAVRRLQGRGA